MDLGRLWVGWLEGRYQKDRDRRLSQNPALKQLSKVSFGMNRCMMA
jgi:hypothetical protein